MMMDRELLSEYLNRLREKYYGYEIVERLEDAGILTVDDILNYLEEFVIEGRKVLEE